MSCPRLRAALEGLPKHAPFSSEQAAAYWADISKRILEAFGWPGASLDSEEFQCTESWRELLAAISSLELLEWRTDFRGFVGRLERAAATQNFKPETLNAPVQIMDPAEAEGSLFDALWIGSCSDDLWPDSPRFSPLIPIALLKEAGVAVVGTPQAEARISRITRGSCSRRRSFRSAWRGAPTTNASSAGVRSSQTSRLQSEIVEMPPLLARRFELCKPRCDLRLHGSRACSPSEVARGGTSLLQEQSNCPFRAFAIRRLLAKETQGPNEALAPPKEARLLMWRCS